MKSWAERFYARIFSKIRKQEPGFGWFAILPVSSTPKPTHPCGHGMYILEGNLVTHKGTFGPGTFVWFPEGEIMEHGASPGADVTVLFITNKRFQIDYVQ